MITGAETKRIIKEMPQEDCDEAHFWIYDKFRSINLWDMYISWLYDSSRGIDHSVAICIETACDFLNAKMLREG